MTFFTRWLLVAICAAAHLSATLVDTPKMQMDTDGNMVTIWQETVDGRYCIKVATKTKAASSWSTPEILSSSTTNSYAPKLVLDADGNAVAVWQSDFVINNTLIRGLFARQLPQGGSWTSLAQITSITHAVSSDFELRVDGVGDVGVVYQAIDTANTTSLTSGMYSTTKTSGSGWSTPLQIS